MTEPEPEFHRPITKQYIADMEQVLEAMSNAESPAKAVAAVSRLFTSVGHAIAALEGEVVLLRQLVHGDDPGLRLR